MATNPAAIFTALSNYNPTGFALENQERAAGLAHQQAATQQAQVQTQSFQLQNQIAAQTLRDQRAGIAAYNQWDGKNPDDIPTLIIKNGGSASAVMTAQQHILDIQKTKLGNTQTQNENDKFRHEQYTGAVQGIVGAPDDQQANLYTQNLPRLRSMLDPGDTLPDVYPGADVLKATGQVHLLASSAADYALKAQQTAEAAGKAKEAAAGTAVKEAQLPGEQAKAQIEQKRLAGMEGAPVGGPDPHAAIDAAIDPARYPDQNRGARAVYDATLQSARQAGDVNAPEKAIAAVQPFISHIQQLEQQTNPALRQARIADEVEKRVRTDRAIAQFSPGAVTGIADPPLRMRSEQQMREDGKELADKTGAARAVDDAITAAQGGNKAAPGVIPIEMVRQLVNRVNRQELASVSNAAGNAWDRVNGFIGKYTEGQPIPANILQDIGSISKIMQSRAKETFKSKVRLNNLGTGAKWDPDEAASVIIGPETAKAPAAGTAIPTVTTQDQFNKLPKGALFWEDGKQYRKP